MNRGGSERMGSGPRKPNPVRAKVYRDRRRADWLAVARFLREHPETCGDDAAAALGWPLGRWWRVVGPGGGCGWFRFTAKGWYLSAPGRKRLEEIEAAGEWTCRRGR